MQRDMEQIAAVLKEAKRVLFITGAGVSAESGVPTFRGATGAFASGLTEEGIPFEDVYEEMLPDNALARLDQGQNDALDMVFSVGTTSIFSYVTWPIAWASRRGIPTVEINPEETPVSDLVRYRVAAPAGVTLQSILAKMAG